MKNKVRFLVVLVMLLFFFRGSIYRFFITYKKTAVRETVVLTNKELIKRIDIEIKEKKRTIEEVIELSNKITSDVLSFTFAKVSGNSNAVLKEEKANCIGYASLFNSICNYIIIKQKLTNQYKCVHLVGELDFLGFDIHHVFNNPFFKDHDFNQIEDLMKNKTYSTDPSLCDYFYIDYVTCNTIFI